MKITVYSIKGSAGKTPIATNIALDRGYALGTNEPYHVLDSFIPEERLLSIEPHEEFPLIPQDINIVFDLAGSISKYSVSIKSAIVQSDVVLIPIYNEVKSLMAGIHTILEVASFTKNIVVIATKLQRHKTDILKDWQQSQDYKNIATTVRSKIDFDLEILPLKFSKVFDAIFEKEQSIEQITQNNPLAAYTYKEVSNQFQNIYQLLDTNYAAKK